MNSQDTIKIAKQFMGWFATGLMVVAVAKLFGFGTVANLTPGDALTVGVVAMAVGQSRGWF